MCCRGRSFSATSGYDGRKGARYIFLTDFTSAETLALGGGENITTGSIVFDRFTGFMEFWHDLWFVSNFFRTSMVIWRKRNSQVWVIARLHSGLVDKIGW